MGKILCSDHLKWSFGDWKKEKIEKVFAGKDCVMALTADGRVLQKVEEEELAIRPAYWKGIREIAVSGLIPGAVIGLTKDGSCMIGKRALRKLCEEHRFPSWFDRINEKVKSWRSVKEVAASDAFFALKKDGTVDWVSMLPDRDCYGELKSWSKVVRIVPGVQDALFGITKKGELLAVGSNTAHLCKAFEGIPLMDFCPLGSEAELGIGLTKEGKPVSSRRGALPEALAEEVFSSIKGHGWYSYALLSREGSLHTVVEEPERFRELSGERVSSFAFGQHGNEPPFLVAVK